MDFVNGFTYVSVLKECGENVIKNGDEILCIHNNIDYIKGFTEERLKEIAIFDSSDLRIGKYDLVTKMKKNHYNEKMWVVTLSAHGKKYIAHIYFYEGN